MESTGAAPGVVQGHIQVRLSKTLSWGNHRSSVDTELG